MVEISIYWGKSHLAMRLRRHLHTMIVMLLTLVLEWFHLDHEVSVLSIHIGGMEGA